MTIKNLPVSVCMASYNGEAYIKDQIVSIISQFTNKDDQLIIVDDCSSDKTLEIIENINSRHIILKKNQQNIGVIKTFEKAINMAENPLIFLSDQDDIWMDYKIQIYKTAFFQNKKINLISSDHILIDENSKIINDTFLGLHWKQVLKIPILPIFNTRCHGPGIAFTQKVKDIILPFPENISSHDQWIAIIISLAGNIKILNVACQFYRIHKKQLMSVGIKKRRSFIAILKSRVYMFFSLFKSLLDYYAKN